jgi:hypothetical protein
VDWNLVHRRLPPQLSLVPILMGRENQVCRVKCLVQGYRETECDPAM